MASLSSLYIILLIAGSISGQNTRSNTLLRRQFYRDPRSNSYNNYSPNRLVKQQRTGPNLRRNPINKQTYNSYDINNDNPFNGKKRKIVRKRKKILPATTTTTTTEDTDTDTDTEYDTDTDTDTDTATDTENDTDYSDLYDDIKTIKNEIEIDETESSDNDIDNIDFNDANTLKKDTIKAEDTLYDDDGEDNDNDVYIKKPALKTKIQNKKKYGTQLQSDKNGLDDIDNDYEMYIENEEEKDSVSNPTDENNIGTLTKNEEMYDDDDGDELNSESSDEMADNLHIKQKKPELKQTVQNKKDIVSQESNSESDEMGRNLHTKKTLEVNAVPNKHKYAILVSDNDNGVGNINSKINSNSNDNAIENIKQVSDEIEPENENDISMVLINKYEIDLSMLCTDGNGTQLNPWIITEEILYTAVIMLSEHIRSIYLPSGYYYSNKPIHINFGSILSYDLIITNGIRIYGKYAYWIFSDNNSNKPSLEIEWINDQKISLFNWEFSGISIRGNATNELVKIGCDNMCEMNDFIIDLNVNNGYKNIHKNDEMSTAIGIRLVNILQSEIKLSATCAQGVAFYLENGQYNNIFGAFSNGLVGKHRVYLNSVCLYLENVVSNTFLSVNMEYCYDGIYFVNNTYGNVFNSLISNNFDNRGSVISLIDNKFDKVTNIIDYLVIHMAIQKNNSYPQLWNNDYTQNIKIVKKMQI